MSTSIVRICNIALSWLAAGSITSLDDDNSLAELCKSNFDDARDCVLEAADWSFAMVTEPYTEATDDPSGYNRFVLKSNVIRVSDVRTLHGGETDWEQANTGLLVNTKPVMVRAVTRVINPALFSPLFTQALAARLAATICTGLTESQTLDSKMWDRYYGFIADAKAIDGRKASRLRFQPGRLVKARRF
jgi:hypothetical protein